MRTKAAFRRLEPGLWRFVLPLSVLLTSCGSDQSATHTVAPTFPPFTSLAHIPTWTASPVTVTPLASTPTLFLQPYDWSLGPEEAPVTLVEYADFQSAACAQLAPVLRQLHQAHSSDVRLVFRAYPLIPIHDKASLAVQAALAAGEQGAFWPMHDLFFARQSEWMGLTPEQFVGWLNRAAMELGLDASAFEDALVQKRFEPLANQAFLEGYSSGVPGTPVVYLNGVLFSANLSAISLEAVVRLELLRQRQFDTIPPLVIDPSSRIRSRLVFDVGEMHLELYPSSAPQAVNSFVFLAQHAWYDNSPVYRVLPGVLIEMGDPTGTGLGGPGYLFRTEVDPSLTFDEPGAVALRTTGPDANGSQFFITLKPLPELNGTHTIFGRVLGGLDWASRLPARDPLSDLLTPPAATLLQVIIHSQ